MSYIRQSNATPISPETVEVLAALVGLVLPAEDLVPLAAALTDQLASYTLLEGLNLENINPVEGFDPRWPEDTASRQPLSHFL
jgi:hypothetical protein